MNSDVTIKVTLMFGPALRVPPMTFPKIKVGIVECLVTLELFQECVYVFMCVCAHACVCISMYTCECIHVLVCVCSHMCVHVSVYECVRTRKALMIRQLHFPGQCEVEV